MIDEYPQPGGQFYRQLAAEFKVRDRARLPYDYTKGDALLARVQSGRHRGAERRAGVGGVRARAS